MGVTNNNEIFNGYDSVGFNESILFLENFIEEYQESKSNYHFQGKLKANFELGIEDRVRGNEIVFKFPFCQEQLKSVVELYGDASKVCLISAEMVKLGSRLNNTSNDPRWLKIIENIKEKCKNGLGFQDEEKFQLNLSRLLICSSESGKVEIPQQINQNLVGTICLVLPSEHKGGELEIKYGDYRPLLLNLETLPDEINYSAFLQYCNFEFKPITSGYRVCLIFNLFKTGKRTLQPFYESEQRAHSSKLDIHQMNNEIKQIDLLADSNEITPVQHLEFDSAQILNNNYLNGYDGLSAPILQRKTEPTNVSLEEGYQFFEQSSMGNEALFKVENSLSDNNSVQNKAQKEKYLVLEKVSTPIILTDTPEEKKIKQEFESLVKYKPNSTPNIQAIHDFIKSHSTFLTPRIIEGKLHSNLIEIKPVFPILFDHYQEFVMYSFQPAISNLLSDPRLSRSDLQEIGELVKYYGEYLNKEIKDKYEHRILSDIAKNRNIIPSRITAESSCIELIKLWYQITQTQGDTRNVQKILFNAILDKKVKSEIVFEFMLEILSNIISDTGNRGDQQEQQHRKRLQQIDEELVNINSLSELYDLTIIRYIRPKLVLIKGYSLDPIHCERNCETCKNLNSFLADKSRVEYNCYTPDNTKKKFIEGRLGSYYFDYLSFSSTSRRSKLPACIFIKKNQPETFTLDELLNIEYKIHQVFKISNLSQKLTLKFNRHFETFQYLNEAIQKLKKNQIQQDLEKNVQQPQSQQLQIQIEHQAQLQPQQPQQQQQPQQPQQLQQSQPQIKHQAQLHIPHSFSDQANNLTIEQQKRILTSQLQALINSQNGIEASMQNYNQRDQITYNSLFNKQQELNQQRFQILQKLAQIEQQQQYQLQSQEIDLNNLTPTQQTKIQNHFNLLMLAYASEKINRFTLMDQLKLFLGSNAAIEYDKSIDSYALSKIIFEPIPNNFNIELLLNNTFNIKMEILKEKNSNNYNNNISM
ncbi:hypothetical protein DICPUDRAFT_73876 [Dictyostelium purpureum]|uniref:Uncharacterized protein n=1 Tax=Dictyostelium purpureum TaxID=5786 RepID=F0Z646_DICPU|nr:uncharacterized protein DICPUDRAFT_73876 [Dictyostelium purpureum]EGC40590.1 hypothetical protein DICPUDRAFT_73876 [Dictyostelium purpureum]|eukprot:XP_003282926.1 hypothetical protein DICPUDRAFT_73876 [Dictyostelium purpureum]